MTSDLMEPHVFCGPEFVLEVPLSVAGQVLTRRAPPPSAAAADTSTAGWEVSSESLLSFQTELILLCSPLTRRRLQRSEEFPLETSSSALLYAGDAFFHALGPIPPPSSQLRYLTARAAGSLSAEEAASLQQSIHLFRRHPKAGAVSSADEAGHLPQQYFLLTLSDSRIAAEVYGLCLRNGCIALSPRCRVWSYFRSTVLRSAPVDAGEVLRRREALRRRWNLDEDLWAALTDGLTSTGIDAVKQQALALQTTPTAGGSLRLGRVAALLAYCEAHVHYASVLDAKEAASPFLIAMGLFWELGLTIGELYTHFIRHPRRVVRALGLFLVRYLLPPEELAPFFYPSLHDDVVIAGAEDSSETCSMRELSRKLLLETEVGEAWLPVYHPFWLQEVVRPALEHMDHYRQQQQQQEEWRQRQRQGQTAAEASETTTTTGGSTGDVKGQEGVSGPCHDANTEQKNLKGDGRGVASLGFRSITDICRFARQKRERTLVPQRMVTLVARTQRRDAEELVGVKAADAQTLRKLQAAEDAVLSGSDVLTSNSDDDDDDFLIPVQVEGEEGVEPPGIGAAAALSGRQPLAKKEKGRRPQEPTGSASTIATAVLPANQEGRAHDEVFNPHAMILKEGYRIVLSLLGRTRPFNADERYLEF